MRVTFTKLDGRRYRMTVVRERGPELAPRQGPGYDEWLPHDAVHFLVEAEAGLSGGAYGRIAAGRSNLFWTADPTVRRRQGRRERRHRLTAVEQAEMRRSEQLATLAPLVWQVWTGRLAGLPDWAPTGDPSPVPEALMRRIVDRLDAFATRWSRLPHEGSISLEWPMK